METTINEFPHHGEHLANDDPQARVVIALLTVFVFTAFLAMLAWLG